MLAKTTLLFSAKIMEIGWWVLKI